MVVFYWQIFKIELMETFSYGSIYFLCFISSSFFLVLLFRSFYVFEVKILHSYAARFSTIAYDVTDIQESNDCQYNVKPVILFIITKTYFSLLPSESGY